jgi:hypothetical protein
MHRRENQFAVSVAFPRLCSSDSALVQAKGEKKPGKARPFFPSGLPQPAANPQGFLHRIGEEPRALLTLKVQTHWPRTEIDASTRAGSRSGS